VVVGIPDAEPHHPHEHHDHEHHGDGAEAHA
jgi:hypothetical protein